MSQTGAQLAQGAALNGAALNGAALQGAALPVMAEGAQSAGCAAGAVPQPKASAAQVGRAVFWSFIGIRKSSGHENDVARITPAQAIIAGLIGAALFVTSLVILVKLLTAK